MPTDCFMLRRHNSGIIKTIRKDTMNTFFYPLQKLNGFERAKECLDTGKTCQVTGCADSQLAHFITGLSDGYKNKVIVTFSGTKAKELYEDLKAFDKNVVLYPAKDFIFFYCRFPIFWSIKSTIYNIAICNMIQSSFFI